MAYEGPIGSLDRHGEGQIRKSIGPKFKQWRSRLRGPKILEILPEFDPKTPIFGLSTTECNTLTMCCLRV